MVGSECALEPTLSSPTSRVLGRVLIPDGKKCVSSMNGNLTAAVLSSDGTFVSGNKRNK